MVDREDFPSSNPSSGCVDLNTAAPPEFHYPVAKPSETVEKSRKKLESVESGNRRKANATSCIQSTYSPTDDSTLNQRVVGSSRTGGISYVLMRGVITCSDNKV